MLFRFPYIALLSWEENRILADNDVDNTCRCSLVRKMTRPERQTDQSPPSSAEVKNAWSFISTLHCVFVAWFWNKRDTLFLICGGDI